MDADCGIGHIWTVLRLTLCLWHSFSSVLLNLTLVSQYNPCSLLDDFKTFVSDMCRIAGNRPVWVTEVSFLLPNRRWWGKSVARQADRLPPTQFQPQGSDDGKAEFLKGAIAWLDSQQCVARYAYFGTADIDLELLDHGGPALSALGNIYAFTPSSGTNDSNRNTLSEELGDSIMPYTTSTSRKEGCGAARKQNAVYNGSEKLCDDC